MSGERRAAARREARRRDHVMLMLLRNDRKERSLCVDANFLLWFTQFASYLPLPTCDGSGITCCQKEM